jgi:hypothetical protein
MELSRKRRACNWLNSKEGGCGQGQNRTADMRIFSPDIVPGLCDAIGHQLNEFNSFYWLRYNSISRLEQIAANSSGKVVAKSVSPVGPKSSQPNQKGTLTQHFEARLLFLRQWKVYVLPRFRHKVSTAETARLRIGPYLAGGLCRY